MPADRLLLVGSRSHFGWCAREGPCGPLDVVWREPGEDLGGVGADVVVCLDPPTVEPPPGALSVAWLVDGTALPEAPFDRVVLTGGVGSTASPSAGRADERRSPWRSCPLPVDDALFAPIETPSGPLEVVAPGAPTPHRELVLRALGLEPVGDGPPLDADVVVVVHDGPHPAFPAWVPAVLAAGALLVSETLRPRYGLEPGIDLLEGASAAELAQLLSLARSAPSAVTTVRRRGQAKVAGLRASVAWPALVADLRRDVAAFGASQ